MIIVLGGAFGVLRVGGTSVHVWSFDWCLRFGELEHCKCTNTCLEVVSIALNVSNA